VNEDLRVSPQCNEVKTCTIRLSQKAAVRGEAGDGDLAIQGFFLFVKIIVISIY
jgi:hypothetical protein